MGRYKKYRTPAAFGRAVERYFRSIRVTEELRHPLTGAVVVSDMGEPMRQRLYLVAPSLSGLCIALGISRDTWASYAGEEGYAEVCADARGEVEAWLEQQLTTRSKGVEGVKFSLMHNYGWREKIDQRGGGSVKLIVEGDAEEYAE